MDKNHELKSLRKQYNEVYAEAQKIHDEIDKVTKEIIESNPDITIERDDLMWLIDWAQNGVKLTYNSKNTDTDRMNKIRKLTEI